MTEFFGGKDKKGEFYDSEQIMNPASRPELIYTSSHAETIFIIIRLVERKLNGKISIPVNVVRTFLALRQRLLYGEANRSAEKTQNTVH